MPKLTVNGAEVEFEGGMTVLQACELAGEEIPRFCYHDKLKIAGNCRMCLVEIEGGPPKPAASCAMPAGDGMKVHTNTPMVKKAREGVMEFQLINHPLDCPICDQGGECDLQDQAMKYGVGNSRFKEHKHSVKDKDYGPLIKTYMTRCIHCTRCVRFMTDIAGCEELGGTGRGESMEIGTFIGKNIDSELSGNIIDICPVGALTSKPYSYTARSWELTHTESVDVHDAVGCNIRVDTRGNQVMRVIPSMNDDINEIWLSDKSRFAYDGLKTQRLDTPLVKEKGKFKAVSWKEALEKVAKEFSAVEPKEIGAIVGDLVDAEAMTLLKDFMAAIDSPNVDCRQDGAKIESSPRVSYLFNSTINGVEEADACLIIGAHPRYDASLVNARIKKRSLMPEEFPIAYIGEAGIDLTYDAEHLGDTLDILDEISSGKHKFSKALKKAKKPLIIVGMDALTRTDADKILNKINAICDEFNVISDEWNGYNVLHKAASRVAGLMLDCLPAKGGKNAASIVKEAAKGGIKCVYLVGADEVNTDALKDVFVVYQGHHGDNGAHVADVILPSTSYVEKEGTYVNLEGRVQRTSRAINPLGEAKDDWVIVAELAKIMNKALSYDDIKSVRERMIEISPEFAELDVISPAKWEKFGKAGDVNKAAISHALNAETFYSTDSICRASTTLAKCIISTREMHGNSKKSEKVA